MPNPPLTYFHIDSPTSIPPMKISVIPIVISSPADLLKHGIKHELCDLCKKEKKVDDLYAARGVLNWEGEFLCLETVEWDEE
jgi:hypothetical protein